MNKNKHMLPDSDTSTATTEWLDAMKSEKSRNVYRKFWNYWIKYCQIKGLPSNGNDLLEDMKRRRLSTDQTEKFFYDNEIVKFFKWLQTDFRGERTGKPLSESSALSYVTALRSFFAYHRYTLEVQKDRLPTTEKVQQVETDHAFDIYQLRSLFQQGDLRERTVLSCGKDLWLRAGDFLSIPRDLIELAIKREDEKAENEKRQPDIIEFEILTSKEGEPASCHLSKESIELLKEYLKTVPRKTEYLFNYGEDALNDLLKRLAEKSKITLIGRVRWHCLRKFGITLMHGKITEPVMKYMTGKHISKDLKTYIQANRETYKAFKMIEPLISLTKGNGNGVSSSLAKELDELKKQAFRNLALQKIIEKTLTKEQKAQIINELAKEFGIELGKTLGIDGTPIDITPDLDTFITQLAKKIEQQDLARILAENGNNH